MRARRRPDGLHAVHLFEIVPEHDVVEFQSFRFVRRGDDEIRRVRVRADVGGGETRNHGEEFHAVALRDADAIQRFEIILMMRDADDARQRVASSFVGVVNDVERRVSSTVRQKHLDVTVRNEVHVHFVNQSREIEHLVQFQSLDAADDVHLGASRVLVISKRLRIVRVQIGPILSRRQQIKQRAHQATVRTNEHGDLFAFGMSLDLTRARRFLWTIVRHFADVNDGEFGRGISVSAERPRFAGGDVFRHEDTLIRQSRLLGTDEQGVVFALDVENGVGDVGNFQTESKAPHQPSVCHQMTRYHGVYLLHDVHRARKVVDLLVRVPDENLRALVLPENYVKHHRRDVLRLVEENDVVPSLFLILAHVYVQSRSLQLIHFHVSRVRHRHVVARTKLHHGPESSRDVENRIDGARRSGRYVLHADVVISRHEIVVQRD